MRICVGGGPKVGKTTFGDDMGAKRGIATMRTDDLAGLPWRLQSDGVITWFNSLPAPWIIEGVPVIRAVRKWLERHLTGKPCDVLYWRNVPFTERTRGQEILATQCQQVYDAIAPELRRRGVDLRTF